MTDLAIRLNGPQTLAMRWLNRAPGRRFACAFGRGVGKTYLHQHLWMTRIAELDGLPRADPTRPGQFIPGLTGVRIILAMPSLKQAVAVHGRILLGHLTEGQWSFLGAHVNRTQWHFSFPGGSWIQFVGAQSFDNARGYRCDIASTDECDDIDPDGHSAVMIPWFSEPWSRKEGLDSGTPRRGRHGLLWRQFQRGQRRTPDADGVVRSWSLHATWRDVPETVDSVLVRTEKHEAKLRGSTAVFEREWECNFDAGEGIVYPMWNEGFHVREPPVGAKWTEILIGVDHGWEDPGVILVAGVRGSGEDAVVHVLEEIYEPHRDEDWWVAAMRRTIERYSAWRSRMRVYADPSMPARVMALQRKAGAPMCKTDNALHDGIAAVQKRMAIRERDELGSAPPPSAGLRAIDEWVATKSERFSRLYVAPGCRNLRRELALYKRKPVKGEDRSSEDPVDKDNHACDALRYLVFNRFGLPQPYRGMGEYG